MLYAPGKHACKVYQGRAFFLAGIGTNYTGPYQTFTHSIRMKNVFRLFATVLLCTASILSLHAQTVVPVGYAKTSPARNFMSFSWLNYTLEKGEGYKKIVGPRKDHVAELKKRILVVQLLDKSEEKYLSRNAVIKDLFRTDWQWNDSIQFRTREEIEKLYEKTDERYAVMEMDWQKYDIRSRETNEVTFTQDYYAYSLYLITKDVLKLSKSEKKIIKRAVLQVTYPFTTDDHADLTFAIQQFDFHLSEAERRTDERLSYPIAENQEALKGKTLLLPQEHLKSDADEESVAKHYKHPFKIVSNQEMLQTAKSKKAGYAYVKFIYCPIYQQYAVVAVDAETGAILSLFKMGGLYFSAQGAILKGKYIAHLGSKSAQQSNAVGD